MRAFAQTQLGKLFNVDCIVLMDKMMDDNTLAQVIFADPPYNIGKAEWDVFGETEYLEWTRKWVAKAADVLSPTGSLFVMGFSEILADIKYIVMHEVKRFASCRWLVWHYRNKPSLGKKDWVRSHESILQLRKSERFTFNADSIREPYNVHTLKYPVRSQGQSSQYGNNKNTHEKHLWEPNPIGAKPRDVIVIPAMSNDTPERVKHPTQKPEELVRKIILATTKEGDLVFDPFAGSGTTPVVCEQMHRRWIASEMDPQYCKIAKARINGMPRKPPEYWLKLDARREAHRLRVRGHQAILKAV